MQQRAIRDGIDPDDPRTGRQTRADRQATAVPAECQRVHRSGNTEDLSRRPSLDQVPDYDLTIGPDGE